MTETNDQTMDAAIQILLKHGIRRTSMSDIAEATGLSRQTLYTRFENKERLVQALISYSTDQIIDAVKAAWPDCNTVAEKMDIFFEHAIVNVYKLMQSMPDAVDLFTPEHAMVAETYKECEKKYTRLLNTMLQPSTNVLKTHGETPASVASLVVTAGSAMKHNATSLPDLNKKLSTLKRMVTLIVGEKSE